MNCCFIAPPQTGHRFAFDLIAYHAQIKLLFSIYLRYRWSRCRSDDTAERSGKQNFLHIIGVEFNPKHYKGKWPCTTKTLYNEKTLIGRLHQYFLIYFETFSVSTADSLFLLIFSILALESAHSIRFLYHHFLSGITKKSLNLLTTSKKKETLS